MQRTLSHSMFAVVLMLTVTLTAGSQALATPSGGADQQQIGFSAVLERPAEGWLPSRDGGYTSIGQRHAELELIVGDDNRQQVTDTEIFPHSAIADIEAWKDGIDLTAGCTAAFIGPNVLLTAAHCLWIPEFGGFADGVAVMPGRNGEAMPFGVDYAAQIWVPAGWIEAEGNISRGLRADYGLILLGSDALASAVGEFSVEAMSEEDLFAPDFQPSTAGYPGDKPEGTQWFGAEPAFVTLGKDLLVHHIDIYFGQSGSPVWRGRDYRIAGVVSFNTSRDNYARRISISALDDMNRACHMLGCSINQIENDGTAFFRTWGRTDDPIQQGLVSRTWMWGPAFTEVVEEPYGEPGATRSVMYHEKSRMEIPDPAADPASIWYVTNGLLARELVTGQMQLGDNRFEFRQPAMLNVAGDLDDPAGPTYASFLDHLDAPPFDAGAALTVTINRDGTLGNEPSLAAYGVLADHYAPETDHRVASVFWDFINSNGLVYDNGGYSEASLFENPYFATGLPITEPYWTTVKVGGVERTVLVQVFERRVLTYTPGNAPGWVVETGNVGLHYHAWRYDSGTSAGAGVSGR